MFDTCNSVTVVHFDRWKTELRSSFYIKNGSHDYLNVKGVSGSVGPTNNCHSNLQNVEGGLKYSLGATCEQG